MSLEDWTRRRPITIGNELPSALSDVQVLITVDYDDDMNVDFSDLRFTDEDTNLLPHWTEHYVGPAYADVWVRVPMIAGDASATIYVYYGNPMAERGDDPAATFEFFDDFEDDVDEMAWTTTGETSIVAGRLSITTGSVYSNDAVVDTNEIVEMRAVWSVAGQTTGLLIAPVQGGGILGFPYQVASSGGAGIGAVYCDPNLDCPINTAMPGALDGAFEHIIGLALTDDENVWAGDRIHGLTHDEPWAESSFVVLGRESGADAGVSDGADMLIDWVLVRQYLEVDPTFVIGGEEAL